MFSHILFLGVATFAKLSFSDGKPIFRKHVVDMSYNFNNETIYWPTGQIANFSLSMTEKKLAGSDHLYYGGNYIAGEHGGTHIDAPFHFAKNGLRIHEIPLDKLQAPAAVVDVREQVKQDPEYQTTVDDFKKWENKYGKIPQGSVFIMCTGWGEKWPNKTAVFGTDDITDASSMHFPGMHPELAKFLVEERTISGIGIDTATPDGSRTILTLEVHVLTAARNIYIIENIKHACDIPQSGAMLLLAPMKIEGGSGAPLRMFATWGDDVEDEKLQQPCPQSNSAATVLFSFMYMSICVLVVFAFI